MPPPWMPLYISDYLGDTRRLKAAQHGAYLLLIMEYWQHGGLPDDDSQLAQIACMDTKEWKRTRPLIERFFEPGWRHKRIDKELTHAAEVIQKRRDAANKRHNKEAPDGPDGGGRSPPPKSANGPANEPANASGLHLQKQTHPPSPSPTEIERGAGQRACAREGGPASPADRLPSDWKPSESDWLYLRHAGLTDEQAQQALERFLLCAAEPGAPYRYPSKAFRAFATAAHAPHRQPTASPVPALTVVNGAKAHAQTHRGSATQQLRAEIEAELAERALRSASG
jgi:uncharacterized protein YdaU (DUF1376 family)